MEKKLLIINQNQFGYHIDHLYYAKYLKKDFTITYLCWDYCLKEIEEEGIGVHYISREGHLLKRNIRFITTVIKFLRKSHYHFIFIDYFRGCSILPILFRNIKTLMHLDIRSGSISTNSIIRNIYNYTLWFESYFFRSISVVSRSLRRHLKLNCNAYILPLGANIMSLQKTNKHELNLLYVGTLTNRRIEDTIAGLGMYLQLNPNADIFYTIIGIGGGNELEILAKVIEKLKLEKYVSIKGYIPHNELINYYERANVGVSYVPITTYYNYQPVTKTFEYLMAGIPVIATATYENRQVINGNNGVLVEDTSESFARGIEAISACLSNYNEEIIKRSVFDYRWEKIVFKMRNELLEMSIRKNAWKIMPVE